MASFTLPARWWLNPWYWAKEAEATAQQAQFTAEISSRNHSGISDKCHELLDKLATAEKKAERLQRLHDGLDEYLPCHIGGPSDPDEWMGFEPLPYIQRMRIVMGRAKACASEERAAQDRRIKDLEAQVEALKSKGKKGGCCRG